MQINSHADVATAIERLTGERVDLEGEEIKGRNLWGRVAFNQVGMLHVEIMPRDKRVNDAVMPTISKEDMQLGRESRRAIYQKRCREVARSMNSRTVAENNLTLLVSSNGHLTKKAKALIEALL